MILSVDFTHYDAALMARHEAGYLNYVIIEHCCNFRCCRVPKHAAACLRSQRIVAGKTCDLSSPVVGHITDVATVNSRALQLVGRSMT